MSENIHNHSPSGLSPDSSSPSATPKPSTSSISNDSDQTQVRITVNLVAAARRHLFFLKTLSDSSFLRHSLTILRSIRRYENLWMPLISDLSKGFPSVPMLLPPLDVQWVWLCHCLSPVSYREFCISRYGHVVERPAIFDDENVDYAYDRCREIWSAEYPSEPFDLESGPEDEDGVGTADDRSIAGGDLFATVARHRQLCSQFSDPFFFETVYLISAQNRYKRFLLLAKRVSDGGSPMVPTADILLMRLTHQSFPAAYARDLGGTGPPEWRRRVVEFGESPEAGEAEETRKVWEEEFDEPYETAGAVFYPASSPSRAFFYWNCSDSDVNRKYKTMHPRLQLEVWVLLKGQWEDKEAKDARKQFLRLRTLRCHREMKIDKAISDLSSSTWRRTWHLYCEYGTKGVVLELRCQGSSCLGSSKLIKTLAFLWNDLLRAMCFTLTRELEKQVRVMASVTPPVQAPYLLKCVPDRVTDDKGAMISDVVLRTNNYHPQEGRWLSRSILDHAGRECFVIRIRIGEGFWRRGAETPRAVKWVDRIIEVREGPWSYVASSVGTAPQKVVGTAVPKEEDPHDKKATWSLSTGDVLSIQWEAGLSVMLETENSNESARLLVGRKLQYQVEGNSSANKNEQEEEQFLTLVRYTPEYPSGRATALLNWRFLALEFLPEEDAVLVLLLCMCMVRTLTETRREDVGNLLVRRRVRETEVGKRDWGSVMVPSASSSPHLNLWFWNACQVLASAQTDDARIPSYKYPPADGKDDLYKQGIMPV